MPFQPQELTFLKPHHPESPFFQNAIPNILDLPRGEHFYAMLALEPNQNPYSWLEMSLQG